MRGVFLDDCTLHEGDIDLTSLTATLPQWELRGLTAPHETSGAIRDATVVVSNKVVLDRASLAAARQLKLVCIAATGTNNIDLAAARELQLTVCNVRSYASRSVVEHVIMLMLLLTRRYNEYRDAVRQGAWNRAARFSMLDFPFGELAGKRLGIIGYGELGRAVAQAASAFGMEVMISQRPGSRDLPDGRSVLADVIRECDILSLHCPLTDATRNLISARELDLMRTDAYLINTARGGIVNEADLAAALVQGSIAGAAVDVLTAEPPADRNPLLELQLPNLIVTPHIAWASRQSRQRLVEELAASIRAFFAGKPRNVVHD